MIRMHATCRYDDRSVAPSGNSQAIDDTLLGAGLWGSARAVVCGGLLGDAEQLEAMDLEVRPLVYDC